MTAEPRVIVYPADEGGCGFYRMIAPAEALTAQGHDVVCVRPTDPQEMQLQAQWQERTRDNRPALRDVVAPEADVVVLQRPLQRHVADAIPMLQRKGVRVVVEIDDDFEHISPRNASWETTAGPRRQPNRNREHLRRACQMADLVTVSTPALAGVYGRHGRVAVLPNYVPGRYLQIAGEPHQGVFVGWSGSIETHPDDLQVTGGGVARAVKATGADVAVVGTGKGVAAALGLAETPLACGWQPLDEYPVALAQFDVGIVPLTMSAFNQAKSWLKGLEMAAVGVPFIASPTAQYAALAALGAGVLATKAAEWEGAVKRLVWDEDHRAEVAERGRRTAAMLTIEDHAGEWLDAWRRVVNTPVASSVA